MNCYAYNARVWYLAYAFSIGSEKDYVILSLVRSLPKREIERNPSREWRTENLGFITDEHQINVALTRAKRGLFIIGERSIDSANFFFIDIYRLGCFYLINFRPVFANEAPALNIFACPT